MESLPNDNAPDWIGLPTSAEMERQQSIGMNLLSNLQKLTKSTLAVSSTSKALCGSKGNYNQYEDVINLTTKWLEALPEEKLMKSLRDAATASVMGNDGGLSALPIPRFMLREVVKADCLIQMILEDVKLLKEVCLGKSKHSSTSRLLLKQLVNERNLNVPLKWLNQLQMSGSTGSSTTSSSTTSTSIMEWISNVALRWFALNKYYKNGSVVSHYDYWIGGMFAPEAFITASRQYVASVNKWNLEDMELYLDINVSAANDNGVTMFPLVGLWIECASWNANKNCIDILGPDGKSDVMKSQLPTCQLRWGLLTSTNADALYLKIPVYSNSTRCHRLFDVHIDVTASVGNNSLRALESAWLQRGIAFVAQGME